MKKIFILTGEPSGDKLASSIITKLKIQNPDIEYLSVGGEHLNNLGIRSIYDLKDITYLGFTSVLLNIFKIKKFNNTESYNLGLYGHYTKESYSLIAHEFLNILSKN